MRFTEDSIDELLDAWPRLRRLPSQSAKVQVVEGWLEFSLEPPGLECVQDRYSIRVEVPLGPTERAPEVFETGRRIPRDADHHVNPNGALCLGSPWRVRQLLGCPASLVKLIDLCVVPFLYAASWREQGNMGYPFAELPHGRAGLLDDYSAILGLKQPAAVLQALEALARHRRDANKRRCPCGCRLRLGRCPYRFTLDHLRKGVSRSFFRHVRDQFKVDYPPEERPRPAARKQRACRSLGRRGKKALMRRSTG